MSNMKLIMERFDKFVNEQDEEEIDDFDPDAEDEPEKPVDKMRAGPVDRSEMEGPGPRADQDTIDAIFSQAISQFFKAMKQAFANDEGGYKGVGGLGPEALVGYFQSGGVDNFVDQVKSNIDQSEHNVETVTAELEDLRGNLQFLQNIFFGKGPIKLMGLPGMD